MTKKKKEISPGPKRQKRAWFKNTIPISSLFLVLLSNSLLHRFSEKSEWSQHLPSGVEAPSNDVLSRLYCRSVTHSTALIQLCHCVLILKKKNASDMCESGRPLLHLGHLRVVDAGMWMWMFVQLVFLSRGEGFEKQTNKHSWLFYGTLILWNAECVFLHPLLFFCLKGFVVALWPQLKNLITNTEAFFHPLLLFSAMSRFFEEHF